MDLFHAALDVIALSIDMVGVGVITRWFILSMYKMVKRCVLPQGKHPWHLINQIRLLLGRYILFGLEFMVASDIINSISGTTLENLLELGLIVLIRIAAAHFLSREIKEIDEYEELHDHPKKSKK